jgi:uncharacterized protein involved in exopolysaccharide biosynthesis
MGEEEEIDLRDYINVLLKRKWLIIGIFLLAVITAAIISYFILPSIYQSSATFKIAEVKGLSLFNVSEAKNKIKSDQILQEVINQLKLKLTPAELAKIIKIETIDDNKGYVKVTVENTSPELARDIAFSLVNQFIELNQQDYQEKIALLEKEKQSIEKQMTLEMENINEAEKLRLAIINSEGLSLTEKQIQINLLLSYSTQIREHYNELVDKYYILENQILNSSNFEIVNYPSIPQAPIKPNRKLNLVIAGVLGLFVGILMAFFAEYWQAGKR